MAKGWTDAEFVVVGAPTRRELPAWFRAAVFALTIAFLLAMGVRKMDQLHPTGPQAGFAGTEAPPQPSAR